jgi:hypothetical protein
MEEAEQWLKQQDRTVKVEGHLLGSYAHPNSRAESVTLLRREMRVHGPTAPWRVRDYLAVLDDTEASHRELLDIQGTGDSDEPADR